MTPTPEQPLDPGDQIVDRASEGARLLTSRGIAVRLISLASNFALIALVAPADFGLLAVVRGITSLVGNTTDLGFAWALLRRETNPSRAEYGALCGVQLAIVAVVLAIFAAEPSLPAAIGSVPAEWRGWMLAALATTIVVPFGTSARIRIERTLDYRWIARYDLWSILFLNATLLGFAVAGRFPLGVFVSTGLFVLSSNLMLWLRSPGPGPSFRLTGWRRLGREFAGFSAAHIAGVLYASVTPILIANLFGLATAGIWAFATRIGNSIQVAFEGFRRAAIPAAAQLLRSGANLRRLAENSLVGAARLTIPLVAAAYAGLPVVGLLWPRWEPAVRVGQLYALGFGVSGLIAASLVPVAVARRGARVVIGEQVTPMVVGWVGFLLLALAGSREIGWVVLPIFATLAAVLWLVTDADVKPRWQPALGRDAVGLIAAVCLTTIGQAIALSPALVAIVAGVGFAAIWLPRPGGIPSSRPTVDLGSEPNRP